MGFAGMDRDEETGAYYSGHRYTEMGRWTNPDMAGFGGKDANLIRYVFNAPTNLIDPTGFEAQRPPPSSFLNGDLNLADLMQERPPDLPSGPPGEAHFRDDPPAPFQVNGKDYNVGDKYQGGTIVALPGVLGVPDGASVFQTNDNPGNKNLKNTLPPDTPITPGIKTWGGLADGVTGSAKKDSPMIVVHAHGAFGGGLSILPKGALFAENLTKADAAKIKKAAPNAVIVLASCSSKLWKTNAQLLANKFQMPVVITKGDVYGVWSSGPWVQYEPDLGVIDTVWSNGDNGNPAPTTGVKRGSQP
jgi:RHS repeat-associated protein